MNEQIIISDIHGCYHTLMKLLKLCPSRPVVFNGDLVDRGPWSRQVVEYAIANKIPTVKGNHEDLMLYGLGVSNDCHYTDDDLWEYNGGTQTLRSYNAAVPVDHLDWMKALPMYLEYDDGKLVVSHTGHGKMFSTCPKEGLWKRVAPVRDGKFYVIGHTPAKTPQFFDHYANIDTGAAYSNRGFGHMTALLWPEKNFITIPTVAKDLTL